MTYNVQPPKAWLITEEITHTLSIISGRDESIFKANIGWVLVDDLNSYPRFKILPRHTFNDAYPELKGDTTSRDKNTGYNEPS